MPVMKYQGEYIFLGRVPVSTSSDGSGAPGTPGENGATFTPVVTNLTPYSVVISWKNDKGLTNPSSTTIVAPEGQKGDPGTPISISIDTQAYTQVDGNIALPVVDMVVTAEDGTTTTYKVVANV